MIIIALQLKGLDMAKTYDVAVLPIATIKENGGNESPGKPFATVAPLIVYENVSLENVREFQEWSVTIGEKHPGLMEKIADVQAHMARALDKWGQERAAAKG
jgi:hypothetical protein